MFNYNLKKILKDEAIPQLSNLIIDELKDHGEVSYIAYNDGGYQLSLRSETEIIDFEPVKQIILAHDCLNDSKTKKIAELKRNATSKIESLYPKFKQMNAALGVYDDVKKKEITDFVKSVIEEVDIKEIEINQKTEKSTLDAVDVEFGGLN